MTLKCVLHICVEYPDMFQSNKPLVIARLVEGLSAGALNIVVSLNRVNNPFDEAVRREGNHWAIRYFAPPLGILQSYFLDRLAERLVGLIEENGIQPNIMIGHKFTIETYVCWRLWQKLRVPYVAGFMGNTDCKVFRAKPHYRGKYRLIARHAHALVFPAPWCAHFFSERLLSPAGIPDDRKHLIPYISGEFLLPHESRPYGTQRFVTICRRLEYWKLKNLPRLIEAIAALRKSGGNWSLDIIGPGSPVAQKKLRDFILSRGVNGHIRLLGGKSREQIDELLPDYCAMVMPSYPESFGLVYLEALGKGVPVMAAKEAGIDGFFPEHFPGVIVTHNRLEEIVQGLFDLSQNSEKLRRQIQTMTSEFRQFDRDVIISSYARLLGLNDKGEVDVCFNRPV